MPYLHGVVVVRMYCRVVHKRGWGAKSPLNGLDGLKVPLLVYTNHIKNEKHVHHGFLAPWVYLCSAPLNARENQVLYSR